ncbi:MAG TPA: hypothetical protein VNM24_00765 [Burkholderiales bacterium]|jgi:hypothetical protein|nr:hypothetical protein [Burkholderiales bacterium]
MAKSDAFHDMRKVARIEWIFPHTFNRISEPSFRLGQWITRGTWCLPWEFRFAIRRLRGGGHSLCGVGQLRFGSDGRATHRHDYPDAVELYARLPHRLA